MLDSDCVRRRIAHEPSRNLCRAVVRSTSAHLVEPVRGHRVVISIQTAVQILISLSCSDQSAPLGLCDQELVVCTGDHGHQRTRGHRTAASSSRHVTQGTSQTFSLCVVIALSERASIQECAYMKPGCTNWNV
jgi:hypothetical protein